jgi:hypothetical protein
VLELCVESGRLSAKQIAAVDVKVTPPAVALANREEEEKLRQMRNQAGVLSVTTWQQQVGLDPKHEAANFAEEARRKGNGDDKQDERSSSKADSVEEARKNPKHSHPAGVPFEGQSGDWFVMKGRRPIRVADPGKADKKAKNRSPSQKKGTKKGAKRSGKWGG